MRNKYRSYTAESMQIGLEMVRSGSISIKGASKRYGVPRATLQGKLAHRVPDVARSGPAPVLTPAEEATLVVYLKLLASIGYPINRIQFCQEVKKVLDKDGRSTPFKDNLPG